MLGKLGWDAVPLDQPIPMAASGLVLEGPACSPLACLGCKLWQMAGMALAYVRGIVGSHRTRRFGPPQHGPN
jgi:hypothetical protein